MIPNMCINIVYSGIDHLGNFDVLIQSGLRVIQNIAFAHLCKTSLRQNYSIFQLPLWMEKVGEEFNISKTERAF